MWHHCNGAQSFPCGVGNITDKPGEYYLRLLIRGLKGCAFANSNIFHWQDLFFRLDFNYLCLSSVNTIITVQISHILYTSDSKVSDNHLIMTLSDITPDDSKLSYTLVKYILAVHNKVRQRISRENKTSLNWCCLLIKHRQVRRHLQAQWWWRHQMETFSALLAICTVNSPISGEFTTQRTVTRSFGVFFDLRMNERLSKHLRDWWLETTSRPLWRQSNEWWLRSGTIYIRNLNIKQFCITIHVFSFGLGKFWMYILLNKC